MIFAALIGLSVLAAFVVQRAFFTDTDPNPLAFRRWLTTMAAIGLVAFAVLVATLAAHLQKTGLWVQEGASPSLAIGELGQHAGQRQRAHQARVCQLVTEIGN